jgi:hypothetical protein
MIDTKTTKAPAYLVLLAVVVAAASLRCPLVSPIEERLDLIV